MTTSDQTACATCGTIGVDLTQVSRQCTHCHNGETRPNALEQLMSGNAAVIAVKSGKRANTKYSLFSTDSPNAGQCVHTWRVIACDGTEEDVVECSRCGRQRVVKCTFDR